MIGVRIIEAQLYIDIDFFLMMYKYIFSMVIKLIGLVHPPKKTRWSLFAIYKKVLVSQAKHAK